MSVISVAARLAIELRRVGLGLRDGALGGGDLGAEARRLLRDAGDPAARPQGHSDHHRGGDLAVCVDVEAGLLPGSLIPPGEDLLERKDNA